jgi:hypothetical protein
MDFNQRKSWWATCMALLYGYEGFATFIPFSLEGF